MSRFTTSCLTCFTHCRSGKVCIRKNNTSLFSSRTGTVPPMAFNTPMPVVLAMASVDVDLKRLVWGRCGVREAVSVQETRKFALPSACFAPKPAIKGLHGGGHGTPRVPFGWSLPGSWALWGRRCLQQFTRVGPIVQLDPPTASTLAVRESASRSSLYPKKEGCCLDSYSTAPLPATPMSIDYCGRSRRFSPLNPRKRNFHLKRQRTTVG